MPGDILCFYKRCDKVRLIGEGGDAAYRVRDLGSVDLVEDLRVEQPADEPDGFGRVRGPWVRFCDLTDGTFLAPELSHTYEKGWRVARGGTVDAITGLSLVIAWSFEEQLRRPLDGEKVVRPSIGS